MAFLFPHWFPICREHVNIQIMFILICIILHTKLGIVVTHLAILYSNIYPSNIGYITPNLLCLPLRQSCHFLITWINSLIQNRPEKLWNADNALNIWMVFNTQAKWPLYLIHTVHCCDPTYILISRAVECVSPTPI